jgi:hypothetical protein
MSPRFAAALLVLAGMAMICWNRRLANANARLNRAIADFLRVPILRRWAHKSWMPAYGRAVFVLGGLMWMGGGILILVVSLFTRVE